MSLSIAATRIAASAASMRSTARIARILPPSHPLLAGGNVSWRGTLAAAPPAGRIALSRSSFHSFASLYRIRNMSGGLVGETNDSSQQQQQQQQPKGQQEEESNREHIASTRRNPARPSAPKGASKKPAELDRIAFIMQLARFLLTFRASYEKATPSRRFAMRRSLALLLSIYVAFYGVCFLVYFRWKKSQLQRWNEGERPGDQRGSRSKTTKSSAEASAVEQKMPLE